MSRKTNRAVEDAVRAATQHFDGAPIARLIRSGVLAADEVEPLAAQLFRSRLVFLRPDPAAQRARDDCLRAIADAIEAALGVAALEHFQGRLAPIHRIEAGYALVQGELERLLDPEPDHGIWASLSLASEQVMWALSEVERQTARDRMVDGLSFTLPGDEDDDERYPADQLINMIDLTTSLILRTYARRGGWVDESGRIVIPSRPADQGGRNGRAVQDLAQVWEGWRRIDDSLRFFGGDLTEEAIDEGRLWRHVRPEAEQAWRRLHLAAHEQLTAEIMSIFHRLAYREDAHKQAAGLAGEAPLYPGAYVSIGERQAADVLEIALSTDIAADNSLYGGLRLVEWIRGYAVLCNIAEDAARSRGGDDRLLVVVGTDQLVQQLRRLGLSLERAKLFIDKVTFRASSHDVVDEPIIRMETGDCLLFGPSLVNGEVGRVLLSKLSRDGVDFDKRGRRFERQMVEQFEAWGLRATPHRARRGKEEYDFDLLVPWQGLLFLFECKSRSAITTDAARAWKTRQSYRDAIRQTQRLAQAIRDHPDILDEALGPEARYLTLVPCVLSALPFQAPGPVDGVYLTDQAALATFFGLGEVGAYATHRIPGLPPVRERLFARSLWPAGVPTAEALVDHLNAAPTLIPLMAHLRDEPVRVHLGDDVWAETTEVARLADDVSRVIGALDGDGAEALGRSRRLSEAMADWVRQRDWQDPDPGK